MKITLFLGVLLACLVTATGAEKTPAVGEAELVRQFKNAIYFFQQEEAVEKIVELHDPSVLPALAGFLTMEDRHARGNAALVYARLGNDRGFQIIKDMLTDYSNRPDVDGMGTGDDGKYNPQLQIRQDRYYAVCLLGLTRESRAIPVLVSLLDVSSVNYRVPWALSDIGGENAIAPLIKELDSPDPTMRLYSTLALVRLKAKEAIPKLRGMLTDHAHSNLGKYGSVGETARDAIAAIEAGKVYPDNH